MQIHRRAKFSVIVSSADAASAGGGPLGVTMARSRHADMGATFGEFLLQLGRV